MQCPECREPLVIVESDGVELDLCVSGHGTWFDGQELQLLLASAGAEASVAALSERLEELPDQGTGRRCPRCHASMRQVGLPEVDGPVLDRCPRGDGLWFDAGELVALLEAAGADPALAPLVAYLGGFTAAEEQR